MKKTIILLIFLILILGLSTVSATEDNLTDNCLTTDGLDDITLNETTNSHNHTQLSDVVKKTIWNAPGGSFADLKSIIDSASAGDTINIMGNYTYNSVTDSGIRGGISLTKTLTFNGNGFTVNGMNSSRLFVITASNVVIDNFIFINCNAYTYMSSPQSGYRGGVMYTNCANLRITNCVFSNNYAYEYGAGVNQARGTATYINCSFVNNFNGNSFALCIDGGGSTATITYCYFENNTIGYYTTAHQSMDLWLGTAGSVVTKTTFVGTQRMVTGNSYTINDNWWGTNSPNFAVLTPSAYPTTYYIMNFTNLSSLSSSNVVFRTTLNTIYNRNTGVYSTAEGLNLSNRIITSDGVRSDFILNNGVNDFTYTLNSGNCIASVINNQIFMISNNDLDVLVDVDNQYPYVGDFINYNIYFKSNVASSNININFTLPSELLYVSGTPSAGSYSSSTGIWNIPTTSANTVYVLKIRAYVPLNPSLVGNIVTANVTGSFTTGNNKHNVNITIQNKSSISYTDLQNMVDYTSVGSTLDLYYDIVYDPVKDAWLQTGMRLNKTITINGHGHNISGENLARIFIVTGANVKLNNFTFINGYAVNKPYDSYYRGGAITSTGNGLNITDCIFRENYSPQVSAALNQYSGIIYLTNCSFINNSMSKTDSNGAHAVCVDSGATAYITGCLFENNSAYRDTALNVVNGIIEYNVFINNTGSSTVYGYSASNYNNNWWGTNNPRSAGLFRNSAPETWIVMGFTPNSQINTGGGTLTLTTSLNKIYNSTSNNYTSFNEYLPNRTVNYTTNLGSISHNGAIISDTDSLTLNYPSNFANLQVNATIDNQKLTLLVPNLDIKITNITTNEPAIGSRITITINVTNNGPYDVTYSPGYGALIVNFSSPSPLIFMSSTSTTYDNNTGLWYVGNLTVGQTKSITLTLKIPFNQSLIGSTRNLVTSIYGGQFIINSSANIKDNTTITFQNKTNGSFTELQDLIDTAPVGGVVDVPYNIIYDPIGDAWLKGGMRLNKTVTLKGNGFTIDGLNQARIFYNTAPNVAVDNLTFIHGYTPTSLDNGYRGAGIYSKGNNLRVTNCIFTESYAIEYGAGVNQYQGSATYINCSFINNYDGSAFALCVDGGGATANIQYCIFENNTLGYATSHTGASLWLGTSGSSVTNSVFIGDITQINFSGTSAIENNWWGTNNPNFAVLTKGVYPTSYYKMNFTNITPITYSAGTSTLEVTLNTLYNRVSNTYTITNNSLPSRKLIYEWTDGTVSPNITAIIDNNITTFNYPNSMTYWRVNATIDNQVLWIGSTDLGVYINTSKNPVNDGDNITINVTIVNNGLMDALDVNISIIFPYGLIINNYTNNSGIYNNTTSIWHFDVIHPGENFTISFNGTLADSGPYLLINATIENNTSIYEENFTNNTYILNVTVIQWSDLEITKNVSDLYPDTKDNVTYTIVVYNHGPSTALNVTVFDNLSSKLIYQISNATKGYYNVTTGIWFINNMTPNSNETLNITVFINQSGFTHNFVNVSCPNNDSNWTNNYANITFETAPLSDLWVTINMEPQSSNYITYHIQAGNNGIEAANGTVVVFNLSNLYVWFNHTTDKGIYNNDTGVWDIGYLDVNETVNMTLIVRLDFPMGTTFANITTSVNITSWSTDLYPENNTDNITFEAEIFGNFRLLQDIVDSWPENTTQILPRSFAYDPIQDAKLPGETYDLINGVRLYKNVTIVNPNGFTLGGFDMARIFNISANNVILDGLRFFDGNSPLGAALNIHADNVQVLRSNFSGNWLFGDYGGAIYTGGRNTLIMDNIFTENSASKLGGAIGAVGAINLQILNNTFINNSVESDEIFGGAIGLINSTVIINGNVFLDNIATSSSGLGSAIYTNNSIVNLEANWFGNNTPDMVTDELIWGNKPETYIVLDWEISNPNMTGVTLNAVFFLYNLTTGNKTPITYGIPYRSLTVTARNPTISWYNTTYMGNNTFNYTYNPSIPVYQVNATVDYQTITLEWSTFLSLNKTLLNDTVWFGDDLIYNITLVNYGPHDSYIVTVSDLLPEGLTINSVSVLYGSTSIIGDDVYWSISINAGSTLSLIVNTNPAHEGVFVNNVTVNSTSQYDYILWGNMSVSGEVLPLFDLSINFTISNPPYYVGEEMNYTITIHNSGPSNASNVSVYIPIPSGLTFLYAWNLDGYIPNYTSSTGLWNVGTLCANETIQINMTLRLSSANWYNQTVNITGDGVEINETDNNQTISFNVTTQVDLELNMTISTNETLYGNLISVTYSLMNKGPSPATNVTMFTVFSGLTYYTAYGYGSFSNITPFTGYWYVGNLNNGSRVTLTLYFYANNVGTFTVTGRANCSDNESYWPDNYDNVTLNVIRYADLSITKTVSDSVAYVGQIINYTISVKNKGVFATENVTVYDVLDSRLIYNNSNPDYNGTHWFIGNLSIGEVRNLTFNVIVNGTGYIWNNASVNSSLNDSNYGDNYDSVRIFGEYKYADLSITKTVSNTNPYIGDNITYTITVVHNAGYNTSNVTVIDILDSRLIYNNSNPDYNGTHWFIGNLSVGEIRTLTFNVTVNGTGYIWNNASVNSSLNDTNLGNNNASILIYSNSLYADLSITKTVNNNTPFLEQTITYTITVTNNAGFTAENVTVYDPLPGVLVYTNSTPGYNGTHWFVGNLSVGESKNLTFNVTVDGIGIIWNNATVNSSLRDPNMGNNHAEVYISVPVADDLRMYINVIPSTPSSNSVFIINLSVWNRGFTDNQNVTVEFHIPPSLTYINSTNMGAYNQITGFWNIGFLGNGQWTDLQIWVYPSIVGNVTLEANVSGQVADVAPWNNRANITFEITPSFDLTITKSANVTNVEDGDLIGFDITVWNNGPYTAADVKIIDYLPNGLLYYSNNASGIYDNTTRTVNWTIPTMNIGDNFTFHLTCRVWNPGLSFTNTAITSAFGTDNNITDNTASVTVNVTLNNDLEVKINASKTKDIDLGEIVIFYITVINHGPSNATNVIAHFTVPSIFTYISDNGGGNYITSSGDWLIGNLGSGNTITLAVTTNLTSMGICTANATVNSTYADKNLSNNYDEINLTATPFFDLNITAFWNLTNNTLIWQNLANLTIIVSNIGPENASNVTVQINIPGVSYINDTSSGNLNTTTWIWNVGNLSVGEYKNITITYKGDTCGFYWTTGKITGHGHDTNLSNNNYTLNLSIIPVVDLVMTNLTVNTTFAGIDEILEFNITVFNKGPCNASNVNIVGFLPTGWYISGGNTVANILANTSHTFNIFVNASTYGNFTVGFNATINGIDSYPLDNNRTIGPINIIYHTNLMITIKVSNDHPVTGDIIVYVITVTNLDWRTSHNVTANITIPSNLTLDHYYTASGTYNLSNGTWTIGNMSFRNSTSMFLFARVNTPGSTDFWVNVTGADYDFHPENNNDTINITTTQGLDLNITINTSNNTPYTGDNVTFTVTVENIGLINATGVNVEVNIPAGFINPTSTDLNFTGTSWYVGNLNIGNTKSFNFTVIPVVTNNLTVNVSVGASRYDSNSSNNFANITISPIGASDLEINITCNNSHPMLNENVTYTITVLNKGMINVNNVIIFNNLPYSLAYATSTPIYSPSSKMWSITNLAPNTIETLNITINHTTTGTFNYTVNITGNIIDTNITNNQDNITITVDDYNDLYVKFIVSNTTILDNNLLNFTITVYNNGGYNNTDVKVCTNLPSTEIYDCSGIFDTNLGIWNVGNLSAGENKTLNLLINMTNIGNYTYWANGTGKQFDKNLSNNNQSLNISVYADYDLKVNITLLNNGSLNVGENITFTITVCNYGPSTAHNINITHNFYGTTSTINVGNLSQNEAKTFNITITPTNNGTYIYNAEITAEDIIYDRNTTNNRDNITIMVINSVDLIITISSNSTMVNKTDTVEILVNVYNNASCTAHNVYVNTTGLFDSNVLTAIPSVGFIAGNLWFIPTINSHQNVTLNITKTITNKNSITANVTSDDVELDNTTNNASLIINVTGIADLKVTIDTNTTNVSLMDNVTFTVTVYNLGEDTAEDVKVYLDLPYSTIYSDVYMYDSLQNIWSIGTLLNGTNKTLNITVCINQTGLITFNSSVNSSTKDNYTNNNHDNITINVTKLIDLEITINSNITDTLYAGDLVNFIVKVVNHGPSNATNIGITFDIPYTILSYNMGIVSSSYWYIGNLATNETGILNLTRLLTVGDEGTYSANVTGFEFERNTDNNNATINLTLNKSSDLAITITSNATTLDMGDLVLYTITVVNYGPDSIANANVGFTIPNDFNIIFNMSSNGIFNGTNWVLGSLGTGGLGIATLYIEGYYTGFGNKTVNTKVNSTITDRNLTNNNANVTVFINPALDLTLNFTSSSFFNPDGTMTFNITVTNNGPANATNVTVYTNLPETEYYNATNGYFDTLQGIWYVDTLNVGESETIIVNTLLNDSLFYANVTNKVKELNDSDNVKWLNITTTPLADLSVNITMNNTNPVVGDSVMFTITVTNLGPYTATDVIVLTDLPASPVYTLSKGLFSTVTGNWSVGSLDKDEIATLNITLNITNMETYNYHVNTSGSTNDTNLLNNNDTLNFTVASTCDLSINLTVNQTSFTVGDNVTFTLDISNFGPSNATNVNISLDFPSGFVFDPFVVSVGTYASNIWSIPNFENNTNYTLNITGILTNNGTTSFKANIMSETHDNDTSNNYASLSLDVENIVDLEIHISSNITGVLAGEYVNIYVNVINHGPGIAKDVIVKTNILNATSIKDDGYYDKETGTWYIGNLNTNTTAYLNLTIQIIENTSYMVVVNSSNRDNNTTNNNGSIDIAVSPLTDLDLTVTVTNDNLYINDTVTYIITVTNNGYSIAENVNLTTNITSTGFTFISTNDTNYNNLTGIWTIGNINTDETVSIKIKYQANTYDNITTNFYVNTTTLELNTTNNNANITIFVNNSTVPVTNLVDLIINITVDNPTPNFHDIINFNITVYNNASTIATNVTIENFLPSGLTPIGTYTSNWTILSLGAYSNASFTFQANVTSYGSFVTNVTANSNQWDANPTDNRANVLVALNSPSGDYTDLIINVTRSGNLTLEETFTYNITVMNIGPSTANDVNVTISIFNGLEYINDTSMGTYNFTNSLWNVGNLSVGGSKTIEITLNITQNGHYNNAFLVYSNEMDKNPQNNLILDNFIVNDTKIDVSVKITANKTYTNKNETILFTVTVTNHLNPATDVNITLDIPDEFIILSFLGYNNGSYYIGNMLSGEVVNFTFTAILNSTNSSTITVNATLNETDTYTSDNHDTITITPLGSDVNGLADLHINITVNEQYPEIGTVPVFTVVVSNFGPDNATNVVVPIYVPVDCSATSFFANASGVVWDNSTSTVSIPQIGVGESVLLDISFRIDTTNPILFNASTYSNQLDPNITDNKASISLYPWEATPTCDLNITIVPIGFEFHANDTVKFNVTIRNFGEKTAFNVSVRNIIPPGLTLESISTTWAYTLTSDGWFMPNHTINTNKSFILTYKIDNKGLYQTTMEVNSSTLDVDPTSNGMGVAIYAGEAEPDRVNISTRVTPTVAVATLSLSGDGNWTFKGNLKKAATPGGTANQNFAGQKLYANITLVSNPSFSLNEIESVDLTGANGIANFIVSAGLLNGTGNYKVVIYYKGEKTNDTYYTPSAGSPQTKRVTINP